MKYLLTMLILLNVMTTHAQKKSVAHKWSFYVGYGMAGSFFFNTYQENEMPGETDYFKKHFLGTHFTSGVGYKLGKNSELELRYSLERFRSKRISIDDTINSNVLLHYEGHLQHINNFFELAYNRKIDKDQHLFRYGIGIYYATFQQQEISVYSNAFIYNERNLGEYGLEEGGILIEGAYEYKFQPKVYLGIKSQFYFTVSTGAAESLTLFPYVSLLF